MALSITDRDRKIVSWVLLLLGVTATICGLGGVWLQGLFYKDGFPTAATFGEVRSAFTWPTAVTTLGSLTISGVLYFGSMTDSWSSRRKLTVFVVIGILILAACAACGHLATEGVAHILN